MKRTKLRVLMVGGEGVDCTKIRGLITNGETGDADLDWKANCEAAPVSFEELSLTRAMEGESVDEAEVFADAKGKEDAHLVRGPFG